MQEVLKAKQELFGANADIYRARHGAVTSILRRQKKIHIDLSKPCHHKVKGCMIVLNKMVVVMTELYQKLGGFYWMNSVALYILLDCFWPTKTSCLSY